MAVEGPDLSNVAKLQKSKLTFSSAFFFFFGGGGEQNFEGEIPGFHDLCINPWSGTEPVKSHLPATPHHRGANQSRQ